jgi:hypothetical protein
MYTLILIFSIKTMYNTSVDVKQLGKYDNVTACQTSAIKIADILKKTDSDIKVDYFCEK